MKLLRCACALTALWGMNAWAGDIQMRGFASMVMGQTLESEETLYGYTNEINFRNDSLVALQFDADMGDKLSATVQLMSRGVNNYEPDIEWAYLTYEFTDQLQLSAGKIRFPFYRYSDFLDVRYTYNWVKAPDTVYGFEFPGYDGLSLVYNAPLGPFETSTQFIYGQFDDTLESGLNAVITDIYGFNTTLTYDWLTLRVGYQKSNLSIAIDNLTGLQQLVLGLGAGFMMDLSGLADDIVVENDSSNFGGVAIGIDKNNFLIDAEYIQYDVQDSLIADAKAYSINFGYRFNSIIPYYTYSVSEGDPSRSILSDIPSPLDVTPIPQLGGLTLYQTLEGALAATEVDTTLHIFGVRYDFHHSAALKFEFTEQTDIADEKIELLRMSVDVVF